MRRIVNQVFETKGHNLTGKASVEFLDEDNFNRFSARFTDFNPERFKMVAVKLFFRSNTSIVTLFAIDKIHDKKNGNKIPVKKFKLFMPISDLLRQLKQFDVVVSKGDFDFENMEIINK